MQKKLKNSVGALLIASLVMVALPAMAAEAGGTVNINTATVEQLMLLPRVGPSVAGRIVEFRDKNGRFKQTADLLLVKGIGDKTFELIKPFVAISGESSLKEKVHVERSSDSTENG